MPDGWHVDHQEPYDELRGGNFIPGKMVWYVIDQTGTVGKVFIPQNRYTYDYVMEVVGNLAREEMRVEGLL